MQGEGPPWNNMDKQAGTDDVTNPALDTFEHGFPDGFGQGNWSHLAYAVAIAFAVFQIAVSAWSGLPSQAVRGIHVGFLLLLSFGLLGNFTAKSNVERAALWLVGVLGFG